MAPGILQSDGIGSCSPIAELYSPGYYSRSTTGHRAALVRYCVLQDTAEHQIGLSQNLISAERTMAQPIQSWTMTVQVTVQVTAQATVKLSQAQGLA